MHSLSVVSSAVDQGTLAPLDAAARLHALAADVAFVSLPPSHAARADVMAAVSQLTAAGGAGAAKAAAARALAAAYRVQVGGGLHVKPLALLLTGISIQALAEVDGVKGEGGRGERLRLVWGEVKGVGGECEGLQGG